MESRRAKILRPMITKAKQEKKDINNEQNGKPETSNKKSHKSKRLKSKAVADMNDEPTEAIMQWKNHLLAPMVRSITGNPNCTYRFKYHHHAVLQIPLQPDTHQENNLFTHYEITTPWTVRLPLPLYCSSGLGPTVPDVMVRFLLVKDHYQRELLVLHRAYKSIEKHRKLVKRQAVGKGESIQNSAAVIYAALLDRDPDPYLLLEYGYDYHFTGGSMATICATERGVTLATVFAAVGQSLEEVDVIQLVRSTEQNGIEAKKVFTCSPARLPGPVLEITADSGGHWVLVRKRHYIVVFRKMPSTGKDIKGTSSSGDAEWSEARRIFSTVPFASVCIVRASIAQKLTVCTTDFSRRLCMWAIEENEETKQIDTQNLPEIETTSRTEDDPEQDNWSAVRCIDGRSLIGCLDRQNILLYSIREDIKAGRDGKGSREDRNGTIFPLKYRGSTSVAEWTMPCERTCALEVAPAEELMFIATCHKILVGIVTESDSEESVQNGHDSSSPSGSNALKVTMLIVFAHNLQQRPVFMSHQRQREKPRAGTDRKEQSEQHFLLFGSHLPMSYGICSFEKTIDLTAPQRAKYRTRYLPLHPPTFHDAYKTAQARGFCLSADDPLKRRFTACTAGMALIVTGETEQEDLHIVLQTSGGDLLQQHVATDTSHRSDTQSIDQEQTKVVQTLHRWHEQLLQTAEEAKPYKATDFRTFKKFGEILNCTDELSVLQNDFFNPSPEKSDTSANVNGKKHFRKRKRRARRRDLRPTPSISSGSDTSLPTSVQSGSSEGSVIPPWQQNMEELQQYKDILASPMLKVWGFGDGHPVASSAQTVWGKIPDSMPAQEDVNERVGNWVASVITADRLRADERNITAGELLEEKPPQFMSTEASLAPGQEEKGQNPLHEEPKLSHVEHMAEQKAPTPVRPGKRKYVKGF